MADAATAMRDPIFYRWHAYIDEIFQEYKATLPAYNDKNVRNFLRSWFFNILIDLYSIIFK